MGKGSPSPAPAPSSQTVTQTAIPEYARPYVEQMLGKSEALTATPYQAYGGERIAEFSPLQQQTFQTISGLQTPGQYGAATGATAEATQRALNAGYQAGEFGNQYQAPGQYNPAQFSMLQAQAPDLQYFQMNAPERVRTGSFAQPGAAQAYMSPYLQSALAPQLAEIQRQSDITQQGLRGQAVAAGAFGGSRQALQAAEAERNKQMLMNQTVGQGYQNAYQQAMQQYSTDAARQLAAQQANQQAGLAAGSQNLAALLGVQQLGAGQSLQAQLANQQALQAAQQAAEQSRQYGYGQGMTASQLAAQYGLAGQQLGEQSRQYGAGLGMQGIQAALQGAGQLGTLGGQQLAAQQNILGLQQQAGTVQQAQAQQALDLAYQDFLKQRNYPYQQLGFMSDMLRGLPLSQSAQQMYTAPPSMMQQLGGLGMAGLGAYGAMGGFKSSKEGGVIKAKEGGLMDVKKYAVGGNIDSLTEEQLTKLLESPNLTPMEQMQIEQRLMLLRRMEMNPESSSIMSGGLGAAPTGSMVPQNYGMAGGGIVAFAGGKLVDEDDDTEDDTDLDLEDEYLSELMTPTSDTTTVPTKGLPTPTNDVDIMRQAIAEATARRSIPLTPGELAEKKLYESAPERAKDAEMRALSGLLMQTGFGAAGSKSRYPLQAFGEAGTAATPTFLKGMGEARAIEESAAKGLGALGRAQRAEQLAGITAGERLGLGAMNAASRERIAEKGLQSRVEIAKLQRASMERIAQARRTDFQRKWELYTADAKKRNVEPNINEFRKLFPETKSGGYLRDIIKSDPMGNPADWYRKADQISRLENLSDEDKAALQWASDPKNAKDPRSAAIKSRLGL